LFYVLRDFTGNRMWLYQGNVAALSFLSKVRHSSKTVYYVKRYLTCYIKLIRNQKMVSVDVEKCEKFKTHVWTQ
jgi:hypothetical protein